LSEAYALIIDDDVNNMQVLGHLLEAEGIECIQVLDPFQIEEIIPTLLNVNIVFLDLEMPGLNGYEILDMLQNSINFQHVPIVAYTVHTGQVNMAHEKGFHSFLSKPLDPDKFSSQLSRILHGERVWSFS
jgi:CheY-like chemotaxis protein